MAQEDIKIIFENDDYLVVDKPAGLIVNRSLTAKDTTLQDILDERSGPTINLEDDDAPENDFKSRSGISHRLDKDTSGLLLVAKNEEFFLDILKQFKERRVEKEYLVVVHGTPGEDKLEIDAPIKRNPDDPLKMAIVDGGKEASTSFETISSKVINEINYTLLRAKPQTGRTHQIRVHLASIFLFVAGDPIYCPRNLLEKDSDAFGRMMLHAHKIKFYDRILHELVQYESPIPAEFLPLISKML